MGWCQRNEYLCSLLFKGSSHVAIRVKTPNTVISFNLADIIVFLGRLQRF